MERSSSQKVLRVIAILNIIGAVLIILFGVVFGGLGASLIGAVPAEEIAQTTAETGMTQTELAGVAAGVGIGSLIAGIVELVCGILCLRAANDNTKIMPAWIISILALVSRVAAIIASAVSGDLLSNIGSSVIGLAIACLTFYLCNTIKAEAGK